MLIGTPIELREIFAFASSKLIALISMGEDWSGLVANARQWSAKLLQNFDIQFLRADASGRSTRLAVKKS
jgi:hypothetical protein